MSRGQYECVMAGNNRGGICLVNSLPPGIEKTISSIHFVDPKGDRSQKLKRRFNSFFPKAKASSEVGTAESAIATLIPNGTLIWSADNTNSLEETMRRRESENPNSTMSYQIMGQAEKFNGQRFGLAGIFRSDVAPLNHQVNLLIQELNRMSSPASSQVNALAFQRTFDVFRPVLSKRHAEYLQQKDFDFKDLSSFPQSISFGLEIFPLTLFSESEGLTWKMQCQKALDLFAEVPVHHRNSHHVYGQRVVVGVSYRNQRKVSFFRVSGTPKGKRRIDGVTEIVIPEKKPEIKFTD